jgi:hypothetical protein
LSTTADGPKTIATTKPNEEITSKSSEGGSKSSGKREKTSHSSRQHRHKQQVTITLHLKFTSQQQKFCWKFVVRLWHCV